MAAIVAFARRSGPMLAGSPDDRFEADGFDLPCPWCRGATHEEDSHCRTCGQRFG